MFVLSNLDFELIKLIGWCKDVSIKTIRKYDNSLFLEERIRDIIYRGYIRLTKDAGGYRLTHLGYELLRKNGLEFHEDKNCIAAGRTITRRHAVADIIIMLYLAGINVFAVDKDDDNLICRNTFIPSFALRRKYVRSENIVGATRFAGIVKVENKTLVPHYVESGNEKLFAGTERSVFCAVGALADCSDEYEIIFVGNNLEALYRVLETRRGTKKRAVNMAKAVYEFGFPVKLVPTNQDGVFQIGMMTVKNWKEKILDIFHNDILYSSNRAFDGTLKDSPFIIGLDFDIKKIRNAIAVCKNVQLNVLCFPFQSECINGLGNNVKCLPIETSVIAEALKITHTEKQEIIFSEGMKPI